MSAREAIYWALWDNYTADQKNSFIDALVTEQTGPIVHAVWDWIISVNDGHGLDAGDLMAAMEHLGATCPEDLEEN